MSAFPPRSLEWFFAAKIFLQVNPYQPPAAFAEESGMPGDGEASARLRKFTGIWFLVLGWISLATVAGSVVGALWWDGGLHFDFSWLLWFWLGRSLKAGSPAARKWTIALFVIITVAMTASLFLPDATARFGGREFHKPHPAYFAISGGIWLVFSIPAIMLLGERGRAAFRNASGTGRGPRRFSDSLKATAKRKEPAEGTFPE